MIFFLLYCSFFIFLYIVYKKVSPILNKGVTDYSKKIKIELIKLENDHRELNQKLNYLTHEMENIHEIIDSIALNGQENIKQLIAIHGSQLISLIERRQNIARKQIKKRQDWFEKDFIETTTKDLQFALFLWGKSEEKSKKFHESANNQAFYMLQKGLI